MQDPTKIKESLKVQLYSLIVFAKVTADYAEYTLRDNDVKREAKASLSFILKACRTFIQLIRAGICTEEGKRAFDAEWQKDYLAWASIFDSLVKMNELQISGVENFCLGVLRGDVIITQAERLDVNCPACSQFTRVVSIGGINYQCQNCNTFFTHKP